MSNWFSVKSIQISEQKHTMRLPFQTKFLFIFSISLFTSSCTPSPENQAVIWSQSIKSNIIKDAFGSHNQILRDSSNGLLRSILFLNGETKLRKYIFIKGDTGVSIFYSKNQEFELFKEFCPAANRTFEGIKYKGDWTGVSEFRYCDGSIKEREISLNGSSVGISEQFDKNGALIKSINHRRTEEIEELKKIKY